MQEADYYGAPQASNVKLIRERLRELYDPSDFVTVINVDTNPLTYQFASPLEYETQSAYPGHKNTIQQRPPQRITLQPGDTKLMPAYEADQMLKTLVKQAAMSRLQQRIDAKEVSPSVSADWTDPMFQDAILKQAFLGKKDILNEYNAPVSHEVEKDLELNEQPRVGRPRKEV